MEREQNGTHFPDHCAYAPMQLRQHTVAYYMVWIHHVSYETIRLVILHMFVSTESVQIHANTGELHTLK